MATGGADILANELATSLLAGENTTIAIPDFTGDEFEIPASAGNGLYEPVVRLGNADLTTRTVDGSGTFDALMQGFNVHLKREFEAGRITGEQYTKAYIALVESAMGNATQFLLGKDAAYWSAVTAQIQARRAEIETVTARVLLESEKTKLQTLRLEALTTRVNYALTKLRLATESVSFDTAKFNLTEMLPLQKTLVTKQIEQSTEEVLGAKARTLQITEQTKGITAENLIVPKKGQLIDAQVLQANAEVTLTGSRNAQTVAQTAGIANDNELHPLRKSMLEKQVAQQTAETANVTKQGVLLDNEAALQPQKADMLAKQILGVVAQNTLSGKQAENIQQEILLGPQKLALLIKQVAQQEAQTAYIGKQSLAIDKELELQPYKKTLMQEQAESQRAQTLDVRSDGAAVAGSMGKQKDLYTQQITSYQRDAEMKTAKVFTDAWVTMKSLDEGLAPPTQFSNTNLDLILTKLKLNNGLN